jgi:hypothetical protein
MAFKPPFFSIATSLTGFSIVACAAIDVAEIPLQKVSFARKSIGKHASRASFNGTYT